MAKQTLTLAFTVNFNNSWNKDYCEKIIRLIFNKANRKLFGRRHKEIKAIGNFELTKGGNTHVHYAVAISARYMSRFVKTATETLDQLAKSSTIDFQVLENSRNADRWLKYVGKQNTLQLDNSSIV
jgi:hypothetical protein